MDETLIRFIVVYVSLHVILFFVELYRFKHSNWTWYGFKENGMLEITHVIWALDTIGCWIAIVGGLIYWIFQPTI